MNETKTSGPLRAEAVPLPELDVSSVEAARKSVRALEKWRAANAPAPLSVAKQFTVTRLAIDNMRFANAQESKVMRDAAHEEIAKLKALVATVESLPA